MEAHATIRKVQHLERVRRIEGTIVNEHITQAPADDHAHHCANDDHADVLEIEAHLPTLAHEIDDHGRQQKAKRIGNAVPARRKRADRKSYGVKCLIEIVEHAPIISIEPNAPKVTN